VRVATGLNGPSGFTFGPGGKIWYLERGTGEVRIFTPSTGNDRLFENISAVNGDGERGALGIALHPNYPAAPYVYVYVTRTDHGALVNELLRYRSVNGHGGARRVLFKWRVVGGPGGASNHNGGRILFGPDGNLWIMTGENANPAYSQQRSNLRGKVLRIRPDGSIPSSNPFGTRIYAFGIRNSFGLTFDPRTGRAWETENGPSCNDEINWIRRGGNYAWGPNQSCGSLPTPRDTNRDGPRPRRLPKRTFVSTVGVTGAAFCDGCRLGAGREGDLFVGDVNTGSVRVLNLNGARNGFTGAPRTVVDLGDGIHSMEVSANGRIYVSTRNAIWRIVRA
jgi:glucose/arabinose dehydrogenase